MPQSKRARDQGDESSARASPFTVADIVFDAIRNEKFYILPGTLPEYETSIRTRMEEILQERNPALLEELLK